MDKFQWPVPVFLFRLISELPVYAQLTPVEVEIKANSQHQGIGDKGGASVADKGQRHPDDG